MQWLNKVVDEALKRKPSGEILVESGGSPSGAYHLGHLRELITSDAIVLELKKRNRQARHIYYVDDLDALRKIPVNLPADFDQYLGKSLCDIPAPDGSEQSYAQYFLKPFSGAAQKLGLEIEFIYSHKKYREGFFTEAIEKALEQSGKVRDILETISGHKLGEEWSPIQINEDEYLKKRCFVSIDKQAKTVTYQDRDGQEQTINYASGDVKLDWRIDWPARWWLLDVDVEPFGRDHATKGGSYDTGAALSKDVFGARPPIPVPYDFVNLSGDTKKMSASKGTGLDAEGVMRVLPPEIVRYFMIQFQPSKRLYFDPQNGVSKLIDEYAKTLDESPEDPAIVYSRATIKNPVISPIPFSLLCESYQAALRDVQKTIEVITRTEHGKKVDTNRQIIKDELGYIDQWLKTWASEDSKFELADKVAPKSFNQAEKDYLSRLADKIAKAPADADGEWFHKQIYELKEQGSMNPQQVFEPLYRALIGKKSGPRAGWFLSILPRDWLIARLRLEA